MIDRQRMTLGLLPIGIRNASDTVTYVVTGEHATTLERQPAALCRAAPHVTSPEAATFILARALIYGSLFVGLLLVFVPGQILERAGIAQPARLGPVEYAGLLLGAFGAAIALWCILTFVVLGRGTPAPFDPPRRLVVRGPYRFVRNPMYLGAVLTLCGASLFYRSVGLTGYAAVFLLATHALVVGYEEPALARLFGPEYDAYRASVSRWMIRRPGVPHRADI